MAVFDPDALTHAQRYQLGIATVVPRPIAWITTISEAGVVNLAPFSYFSAVCSSPMTLSIAIGDREPEKDTLRNLKANGQAVVHLVPPDALSAVHTTGGEFAEAVSEVDYLQLATIAAETVRAPRLLAAQVVWECTLASTTRFGAAPTGSTVCFLTVQRVHVVDDWCDAAGMPDPHLIRAPARLGGSSYVTADTWTVVDMPRAQVPEALARKRPAR